ncbi:hypothetical protein L9H26_10440 [Morganella psychrotolerans]|uniref:Uncharacterized protein n=2 Tax=Morganella psychrotolerans TaxID=368603 RepID=A0A5M9QVM3_9GAMM|nr:hypothetical protein [Morganella psychrotolerans]KAA8712543.1 hypothetical protein F4V73_18730 [Morganella psychrotolerans]
MTGASKNGIHLQTNMVTKLISLSLSIIILLFLYCFLSPTQYFPATNHIKSLLLVSDFIRNAPDKEQATYYYHFWGDRGQESYSAIYYCQDKNKFNELEIKLHQYANSRRSLVAVNEITYRNKYNENRFISIHESKKDNQECMSLSEYEYTYD